MTRSIGSGFLRARGGSGGDRGYEAFFDAYEPADTIVDVSGNADAEPK
ncbi:MAG: hypothetical protein R3F19_31565 [Verrucomicrobiales bacterium]